MRRAHVRRQAICQAEPPETYCLLQAAVESKPCWRLIRSDAVELYVIYYIVRIVYIIRYMLCVLYKCILRYMLYTVNV